MKNSTFLLTGKNKTRLFWILNMAYWSFFILREYLAVRYYKPDIPDAFFLASITYIIGFVLSVSVRYLFIRVLSRITSLMKMAFMFACVVLLFAIIWRFMDAVVSYPFWSEKIRLKYAAYSYMDHIMESFQYFLTMMVWGAVYFIVFLWERIVLQRVRTQEAENLAAQARFKMLQNQVNPHFLFNSLNSIRALIFENQQKAADLVTELSDFLRYNLSQSELFFIPLEQEIEAIGNYLAIEKKRYEQDLQYSIEVAPGCIGSRIIPNLLLPLVDNAVKYGIRTSPVPLQISIKGKVTGEKLILEVLNTGRWSEQETTGSGKGIQNVKERLENIYRERFGFIILKEPDQITVVIEIPLADETDSPGINR